MIHKTIYFAAIVHSQDPDQIPFTSTPLGPYGPDETDAHTRAVEWLKTAYKTDDVRMTDLAGPDRYGDFTVARSRIMRQVADEHTDAVLRRNQEQARAALDALGPESWALDVCAGDLDQTDLDAVLAYLGVNPADV